MRKTSPSPDNSFDIIISVENLEHLPNIDQHLFEVKRVLKPNGIYLIKTPNKLCGYTILGNTERTGI